MITVNPILKIKDLEIILDCSKASAQRIYSDIKKQYKIKLVTQLHLNKYLKL